MKLHLRLGTYNLFLTPIFLLLLLLASVEAKAQYFGRNKFRYRSFNFQVAESPHFRLYHYLDSPEMVQGFIRDAERWYSMQKSILRDTIEFKNPVILYNNHADFQQTNAISGNISIGTGGVTEGMKNRVVMPLTSSPQETRHVLGHELVHAFQYNMLRSGDSTSISSIGNLPLWMVEGLAEYMSVGNIDPNTAMWMRDAVLNDNIPTLEDLTKKQNQYFPYRYGQAFWAFVTGMYGDTIIAPFFKNAAMYGYPAALHVVLRVEEDTIANMLKTALQQYYHPYLQVTDTIPVGTSLTGGSKEGTSINIAPALSPDGSYFAYNSERNIFSLDLFLADAKTGEVLKRLSSNTHNTHIDNFSYIESAGTFSPRGNQFAFVVFSEGKNKLNIVDVAHPSRQKLYEIEGVPSFNNPAWSPDGHTIVVTGTVEGKTDLYAFDVKSKNVERLTDDTYVELVPAWSPDGRNLVFSTDRTESTFQGQAKHAYQIALMDIRTKNINVLNFFPGASNLNPVFDETGQSIYFLSDRDGFRNLYRYYFTDRQVEQYTDYFTGISGITSLSPALTVASQTGQILYSYYRSNTYELYTAQPSAFDIREVDPDEVNFEAGMLPPVKVEVPRIVNQLLTDFTSIATVSLDSIKQVPYQPRFKLDYISNSGLGVATNRIGTGLAGGVNMIFSDILGNQQLFGGGALNGEIYDFGGQFAYINQRRRLGWGALLSHIPYQSAGLRYLPDTIRYGGAEVPVTNVQLDLLRIYEDQASFYAFYPFSTAKRMEFGTTASHYGFRRDLYNNYYYSYSEIAQDWEGADAPEGYYLFQSNVAFVNDNSYFGTTSPLLGSRYRLEVGRYFGKLDFYTLLADVRRYFFIKPISLALRFIHYGRYGGGTDKNNWYPLYIGNPYYIRGYDSRTVRDNLTQSDNYVPQLVGSKMLVGNFEVRIPFSGPKVLCLFESENLLTDLNFFVDGGLAYSSVLPVGLDEAGNWVVQSTPVYSTGVAVRMNVFGQLILEPYYAFPIQENGWKLGNFGLNFLPGW